MLYPTSCVPHSPRLHSTKKPLPSLLPLSIFALNAEVAGPLSFDPTGNYLYLTTSAHSAETSITAFRMEHENLRAITRMRIPAIGRPEQLLLREHALLLVGEGGIASLTLDPRGSLTNEPEYVVRESGAASLALLRISSLRSREGRVAVLS